MKHLTLIMCLVLAGINSFAGIYTSLFSPINPTNGVAIGIGASVGVCIKKSNCIYLSFANSGGGKGSGVERNNSSMSFVNLNYSKYVYNSKNLFIPLGIGVGVNTLTPKNTLSDQKFVGVTLHSGVDYRVYKNLFAFGSVNLFTSKTYNSSESKITANPYFSIGVLIRK